MEAAPGAVAEERISVASNWTLVWWRFRKHRLALASVAVLAALYAVVLCPEFFSTQDPEATDARLNDAARLAWDCYENQGRVLPGALEVSAAGAALRRLGYDEDVKAAAQVDKFALVPELRRDPLRVEVGAVGFVKSHWRR